MKIEHTGVETPVHRCRTFSRFDDMFKIGRQILLRAGSIRRTTTQPAIAIFPKRCVTSRPSSSVEVLKKRAAESPQKSETGMDRVPRKEVDIIKFLEEHNQRPGPSGKAGTIITNCPHCLKVRKASFAAHIELDTGKYSCKTCHASGSWSSFTTALEKKLGSSENYALCTPSSILKGGSTFSCPPKQIESYPMQLQQNTQMLEKLTTEYKLGPEIIKKYRVGLAYYADPSTRLKEAKEKPVEDQMKSGPPCYTFPQTALTYKLSNNGSDTEAKAEFREETVRIKACSLDDVNSIITYDPPNISESRSAGLFGYHLATAEDHTVILTRRELDAMAAYQATGIPSFALPTINYQLHESVLPLLERFSKIYVWLDDDLDGNAAAERFAKKLGEGRCLLVNSKEGDPEGPKTAYEAMIQGGDLKGMLNSARRVKHEQILDFMDLREEVYREIMNPEQTRGVQSNDLPALNSILKGHRPGELTILTGPTGMGKTTVISQLSLDYCKSGVPTLWGSFEIANKRLAKRMLYQFAGKDLSKHPEEFPVWADQFQQVRVDRGIRLFVIVLIIVVSFHCTF